MDRQIDVVAYIYIYISLVINLISVGRFCCSASNTCGDCVLVFFSPLQVECPPTKYHTHLPTWLGAYVLIHFVLVNYGYLQLMANKKVVMIVTLPWTVRFIYRAKHSHESRSLQLLANKKVAKIVNLTWTVSTADGQQKGS